jgi:holin-like protein
VNNKVKTSLKVACQVGLLTLVSMGGNELAARLHLPVPGSMVGMLLVFLLLRAGMLKLAWVEEGAGWLMTHLLLFFIPAAAGIVQYRQVMAADGSRIALVIALSTIAVMMCTGLLVEFVTRRRGEDAG